MSEAIIGGLIGGPLGAVIALFGNYIVVRDTRWGRVAASEEKAAATLITQLRRVRLDHSYLHDHRVRFDFSEDCLAAVLAFRDHRVRARLGKSIWLITQGSEWRRIHGGEAELTAHNVAVTDIRRVLEARLDGKRLPKPADAWILASTDLGEFLEQAQATFEEAERIAEVQREAQDEPWY
jgi:hypothetical protein